MRKNKSSLILMDKNGFTQKSITISSHYVLNWKKYFIGFVTLFLILGLIIGYTIYTKTSEQYTAKLDTIEQLNSGSISEHTALYQTVADVNDYVAKLNVLLGVKGLSQYAAPNLETKTKDSKTLLASNLNSLQLIAKELEETPIGTPHDGRITSTFGTRSNPFSGAGAESHSGIDFKGQIGETVKATAQGKVVQAGVQNGYGNCVVIEHKNGVKTLYAHLNSISVQPNQEVNSGTKIGELGNTGRSTGSHLHYEVIENGVKVNPAKYMKL